MKLRNALLAATVMALPAMTLPGTAQAQPVTGLYIAGGAGANFQHNFRLSEPVFNPNGSASSEVGFVGLGSIGWGFGNGLRVELEGSWRAHRINRITPSVWWGGRTDQIGGMVNALYDFNGVSSFMVPYIGAGVGAAHDLWIPAAAAENLRRRRPPAALHGGDDGLDRFLSDLLRDPSTT